MKLLLSLTLSVTLCACAAPGTYSNTGAYKDCVLSQAMDMAGTPESTDNIVSLATAQCQGNLAMINEKLRKDDAWMSRHASDADGYTEKLRDATKAEVLIKVKEARGE